MRPRRMLVCFFLVFVLTTCPLQGTGPNRICPCFCPDIVSTAGDGAAYSAGDIVEARIPDTSQWFPAVVCWVERGKNPPLSIQLLIEYENTKMGTSLISTKDVRICHDFDWYVQSLLAQLVNV